MTYRTGQSIFFPSSSVQCNLHKLNLNFGPQAGLVLVLLPSQVLENLLQRRSVGPFLAFPLLELLPPNPPHKPPPLTEPSSPRMQALRL